MKKILMICVLLSMCVVGFTYAHPGDDLDSASGCHVCKTNCTDYGLSYGEFHCHKTSLEYEIQAIQSYYSSKGFGRSSAVDQAIEQAKLRFSSVTPTIAEPTTAPTYTIPTYTTTTNKTIENYNYLIDFMKISQTYYNNKDYDNAILTLYEAMPYAIAIGGTQEESLNTLINNIKTHKITEAFNQCQLEYGNMSYGFLSGLILSCYCAEGYDFSTSLPETCVKISTNQESNNELINAVSWMYNNELTTYNTINDYRPDDFLTREQASKFFVLFSKKILGKIVDTKKSVSLSDLKRADKTLQSHIKEANQLGLFKGVKGKFLPFNKLTRAQTLAVIIRSIAGNQNEKGVKWYAEYYNLANSYSILEGLGFDYTTLDSVNITRGEVALLLYRLVDNGVVEQQ